MSFSLKLLSKKPDNFISTSLIFDKSVISYKNLG